MKFVFRDFDTSKVAQDIWDLQPPVVEVEWRQLEPFPCSILSQIMFGGMAPYTKIRSHFVYFDDEDVAIARVSNHRFLASAFNESAADSHNRYSVKESSSLVHNLMKYYDPDEQPVELPSK